MWPSTLCRGRLSCVCPLKTSRFRGLDRTQEERREAAVETIKRRALNNQAVLRRKLKAASYGAAGLSGGGGEAAGGGGGGGGNVDWEVLFHQMDKDGNGCAGPALFPRTLSPASAC